MADQELSVELSDSAMALLADKGYDPSFGARPLKRVIQHEIENPLSMAILKGEAVKGRVIRFSRDTRDKKLILRNLYKIT